MTLDELKQQVGNQPPQATKEAPHPQSLPWWVVVRSKKPNPDGSPRFKFDFGFVTKEEAEQRRKDRQDASDAISKEINERNAKHAANMKLPTESVVVDVPFKFFVIERPAGAHL